MSRWVYRRPSDYRSRALQVVLYPVASGAISATLPIVLAVVADLKAKGKLSAESPSDDLPIVFGIAADLQNATASNLDATLPIVFGITADLKAKGKLDAALPVVFGLAATLDNATPPPPPIYIRRLKGIVY